ASVRTGIVRACTEDDRHVIEGAVRRLKRRFGDLLLAEPGIVYEEVVAGNRDDRDGMLIGAPELDRTTVPCGVMRHLVPFPIEGNPGHHRMAALDCIVKGGWLNAFSRLDHRPAVGFCGSD